MFRAVIIILLSFNLLVSAQDSTDTSVADSLVYPALFNPTLAPLNSGQPGKLTLYPEYQRVNPNSTEIDYNMLMIVGGATAATVAAIHTYQLNAWWQEQDSQFKVVQDWEYVLWVDKIGHFYATNLMGHVFSMGFEAANFETEQTYLYGGLMAFLFELYIEVEDGFGPQWGFSPGDITADFLGATYFISQYYYPFLKNFQPRVSYFPSEEMRNGQHKDGNISDDYEGQKYWLSMRMKEILPKKAAKFWPDFLMLSVGVGGRDFDGSGGGTRELYIGLDFDVETLPLHGPFWESVKNTLSYLHFPLPAVRISPDTAFLVFGY